MPPRFQRPPRFRELAGKRFGLMPLVAVLVLAGRPILSDTKLELRLALGDDVGAPL
jgi:hypothetical protein